MLSQAGDWTQDTDMETQKTGSRFNVLSIVLGLQLVAAAGTEVRGRGWERRGCGHELQQRGESNQSTRRQTRRPGNQPLISNWWGASLLKVGGGGLDWPWMSSRCGTRGQVGPAQPENKKTAAGTLTWCPERKRWPARCKRYFEIFICYFVTKNFRFCI